MLIIFVIVTLYPGNVCSAWDVGRLDCFGRKGMGSAQPNDWPIPGISWFPCTHLIKASTWIRTRVCRNRFPAERRNRFVRLSDDLRTLLPLDSTPRNYSHRCCRFRIRQPRDFRETSRDGEAPLVVGIRGTVWVDLDVKRYTSYNL